MKKRTRVIGVLLAAVSAASVIGMTANASQYEFIENHNNINCMHTYKDGENAIVKIRATKDAERISVDIKSETGGYMSMQNEISLNSGEKGKTDKNATLNYVGSDENNNYFILTVKPENDGIKFNNINVKAYSIKGPDKSKDTNTNDGKFTDGTGYNVAF